MPADSVEVPHVEPRGRAWPRLQRDWQPGRQHLVLAIWASHNFSQWMALDIVISYIERRLRGALNFLEPMQ